MGWSWAGFPARVLGQGEGQDEGEGEGEGEDCAEDERAPHALARAHLG